MLGRSAAGRLVSLFVVVHAAFACTLTSEEESYVDEAPILNGAPSSRPEVVLLANSEDKQACSGTLIAPDVVLSAAHCVRDLKVAYVGYSKRAPRGTRIAENDDGGTWTSRRIVEQVKAPGFENQGCPMVGADVALLRLEAPVEGAALATLAEVAPTPGEECVVVGYGRHNVDEDAATVESAMAETSHNEQRAARVRITSIDGDTAFSAQGIDGAHSKGDSGGPIFCGERIAGIVSCSPDRNASVLDLRKVYANVQAARAFIDETLERWRAEASDAGASDAGALDPDAGDASDDAPADAPAE